MNDKLVGEQSLVDNLHHARLFWMQPDAAVRLTIYIHVVGLPEVDEMADGHLRSVAGDGIKICIGNK